MKIKTIMSYVGGTALAAAAYIFGEVQTRKEIKRAVREEVNNHYKDVDNKEETEEEETLEESEEE